MTHPTLGYNNLRFDGDALTHMPATPTATMCVACSAGNGPLSGDNPFPHDMDAAVDCPNCLRALESDWWMALMENERRTGETTSLTGTLDDVRDGMARLLSQVDAVTEETLLGGGASMFIGDPATRRPVEMLGHHVFDGKLPPLLAWATQPPEAREAREAFRQKLIDAASPVTVDVTQDYLFMEDKVTFRARRGNAKAYEHVENPVTPEKLADAVTSLARKLGSAPPSRVRQMLDAGVEKMNTLPEGATLSHQVRAAVDAADEFLAEHPFTPTAANSYGGRVEPGQVPPEPHDCDEDSCSGQTFDPPCGGCCRCLSGCVYDGPGEDDDIDEIEFTHGGTVVDDRQEHDYPDQNWCHVHNRAAIPGREQCSECDGEQGEERSVCRS